MTAWPREIWDPDTESYARYAVYLSNQCDLHTAQCPTAHVLLLYRKTTINYALTLKKEAARSSETLVSMYHATRRQISDSVI
jgi:hypothetical protein